MKRTTAISLLALCFSMFSLVAGFTYTFRTDTPGASDDPREGDDRMREIKAATQERMDVDHYWYASATSTYDAADCGKHRFITFREPNSVSTVPADEGVLFTKDVSSKAELHWIDEDENELQLTSAGAINLASADLLGVLANDAYFTAVDAAGTGTVNLIKATTGDAVQILAGAALSTSAAPTTDAMIANKKYVDDTHNPTVDGTAVFNTTITTANAWQDLDLSSYVGSGVALVYLEVKGDAAQWFAVKPKGYGDSNLANHYGGTVGDGASVCYLDATDYKYLVCVTDSSGVMRISGNNTTTTVTIKLIGYVN